jgi:hypothetical protein
LRRIIDIYWEPGRAVRELHELVKSGSGIDPLKEFSNAAREALEAFVTAVKRY